TLFRSILQRAEDHVSVPSAGAETGPARATKAVQATLAQMHLFDEAAVRDAHSEICYWQHQLAVTVATWTAAQVPGDPAAAAAQAKQAKRAKGRRHLGKPPPPMDLPPLDLQGANATPLGEMFPAWAEGLKRLRAIVEKDPGKLRGQGVKQLPLRFSRATGEVTARGMNWLLDLMLCKDPRAAQGFKYDAFSFETDDGDSHIPLFKKVSAMGEPGSSQGLGTWSDDYIKYQTSCAAGLGALRSMMRLASFGSSKRSPAFVDGAIGDADLLAALLVLWPMITMGGINRRATGDLQAHKARTRVQAFFDGRWDKWLHILEGHHKGTAGGKASSRKMRRLTALEKVSIGALSKANACINADEDLRCAPPESDLGDMGFKNAFGKKHQVVDGELGRDSRELLRKHAQAMDAASRSAYAGATAGYPKWLIVHVLQPHLVIYLCKAKDNARAKVARFYELDRRYAKGGCGKLPPPQGQPRPQRPPQAECDRVVAEMTELVASAMRPVMVPTPLLRFHQRIDVAAHTERIRSAFSAYQYCACVPGGTENITWLARLCWDHGIPFLQSDVPNGFPGADLGDVWEAVCAVIPCMRNTFLRWCENGFAAYGQDNSLIDHVVGGMAQGDPLVPCWFGALMVHKMKLTEKFLAELGDHSGDERAKALALFYADDGFMTSPEPAKMLRYRKHFKGKLASKDDVYVHPRQTRA
ncbi:MAG: hypothetical protein VB934_09100, partial [Polyangiaceae bacterium]